MTEHDDVIRLLNEGRPQATEMELDQIKQRVRHRVAASGRKQEMKSRVAILGMLVAGALFSTAGVGLAVSGTTASQTNASVAQYPTPTPTPTVTPACVPSSDTTSGNGSPADSCSGPCTDTTAGTLSPASGAPAAECSPTPTPEGGVLPAEAHGNAPASSGGVAPAEAANTQPVRQEAAAANTQLPFTGFAAIPVILGGLALLTGGLILRRRTKEE
jgi:uncharacterized membrane protein